ncbi:MAG: hypothetical protein IIV90_00655 [Oscillospiraceae bacterium]|nr:hypothetical protein [Oscillospiraceae bacterium]
MELMLLKKELGSVALPPDAKARILETCARAPGKKAGRRGVFPLRRAVAWAAALILCLALPAAGLAMGNAGHFKDILNWQGAVVGTEYLNAAEEIQVEASLEGSTLTVAAVFAAPQNFPYREQQTLALGPYTLTGPGGEVLAQSEGSDSAPIEDGKAVLTIPLGAAPAGPCTLTVESFLGGKKADQPLPMAGPWEIPVTP